MWLRIAAVAAAAAALAAWQPDGYGWPFWIWVVSAIALGLSLPGRPPEVLPRAPASRASVVALLAVLLLATALRLPEIREVPANVSIDEMLPALEAMRIAAGEAPNVFSSVGWFTIPNLSFAIPGAVMAVLPSDPFYALRLSSLLTGLAGIIGTFLLARRLFGDGIAVTAAFLMAAGFWHIHNSRTGFPFVQTSCAVPWVLYLLVRARQERSAAGMFVAGVALGLALQLYFPVRILLLLVPLFLVTGWLTRRDRWRRWLSDGGLIAAGALLALAPLLVSVPVDRLLGRSQGVLLTQPGVFAERARIYQTDATWEVVRRNFAESAGMFTEWADVCILNRSPGGLFDSATLFALLLGGAIALVRLQPQALLLVAWSALVFVLGVAISDAPRASYRLSPAMPALYMLAAYGLHAGLFSQRGTPAWYRTVTLAVLAIVLGSWIVQTNRDDFFVKYAQHGQGRPMPPAAALRFGSERCDGRGVYLLAYPEPFGADNTTILFCPQYRAIRIEAVPDEVDLTRAASFVVMGWNMRWLEHLRECYPNAVVEDRRAPDGRFLFASVDVTQAQVALGPQRCRAPETGAGPEAGAATQAAPRSPISASPPRRAGPAPERPRRSQARPAAP